MSYAKSPERPRRRVLLIASVLALVMVVMLVAGGSSGAMAQADQGEKPTIVLVHGDWADASSWNSVIQRLQRKGFTVVAPPNLLRGPAIDAPYLASYLETISGPIVLVAHSYGGFVITNAATGNPDVEALVYIDSFLPDEGETAGGLIANSGSCIDPVNVAPESAFNFVPFDGGLDLYLRWEANPPYPGFARVFRQRGQPRERRGSCRDATACVRRAIRRPFRASRVEDDPVLVAHRNP